MTTRLEQIAEQVKSLPASEREELLSWLAEFELGQTDSWDAEMARDSQPGGRMQRVLDRVRRGRKLDAVEAAGVQKVRRDIDEEAVQLKARARILVAKARAARATRDRP